jgi:hypothetical protein
MRARLLLLFRAMRPSGLRDLLSSRNRAPAAMAALLVIVAAALAWLSAGC